VKDHAELRRDGIDIHSDIDISYVDAILGSGGGADLRGGGGGSLRLMAAFVVWDGLSVCPGGGGGGRGVSVGWWSVLSFNNKAEAHTQHLQCLKWSINLCRLRRPLCVLVG